MQMFKLKCICFIIHTNPLDLFFTDGNWSVSLLGVQWLNNLMNTMFQQENYLLYSLNKFKSGSGNKQSRYEKQKGRGNNTESEHIMSI